MHLAASGEDGFLVLVCGRHGILNDNVNSRAARGTVKVSGERADRLSETVSRAAQAEALKAAAPRTRPALI
jgi:hypothetical protein